MQIRKITPSDAAAFIEFFTLLLKQTDFLLPSAKEAAISVEKQTEIISALDDFKQIFIASDSVKNRIVGFIGVTRFNMEKNKHIANFAIGVLKDSQKHGLAEKLLAEAEKWLKAKNVRRLELTVIKENIPAIRFYEKHGFKNEGLRRQSIFMNGKFYDEFYMAKDLGC